MKTTPTQFVTVVGLSECIVSNDPFEILITHSLGSCLGISAWDPIAGVGGLMHCMLPLSRIDREKAKKYPAMFVDTGFIHLFREMNLRGSNKEDVILKIAGCGQIMDPKGLFNIGSRNVQVLDKLLKKNNLSISSRLIGGDSSKTLVLNLRSGTTMVKNNGIYSEI